MTEKPKKTARDLSDLKARLGLAKPGTEPASAQQQPQAQQPVHAPHAAPPGIAPPPGVVPPPGVAPPPGMAPAPAAQPPPDVRRDPFAGRAPTQHEPDKPIVDAGPAIEIPKERKSPTKLIIAFVITALIPMGVGWACGRIYASRVLFNKGIEDAAKIKEQVLKMATVNKKVAEVLHKSRVRQKGLKYDAQMLEDLKDILRKSPNASADKIKTRQDELFRTNYAMMESVVIDRLFNYYNDTIRLMAGIELFIRTAEQSEELLKKYSDSIKEGQRKYGIVFAEDAGKYYLGKFVEVGNLVCADEKAKECPKDQIKGFFVRTSVQGSWSPRPGKPSKPGKIAEVVIPIIPDEFFRQIVVGRPGYLAYKDYVRKYGQLSAIAALLSKTEKELVKDLGKAAGRDTLFVF